MEIYRNYSLITVCISFLLVIGAGLYEHLAMVPRWSAAPPTSLTMFDGPYGANPGAFWKIIHPITLLVWIVALALHWPTPRRMFILLPLIGYVIVLGITFAYFVPELMRVITTPVSNTIDNVLQSRARLWEKLSLARLVFLFVLVIVLLRSLTLPAFKS